MKKIAFIFLFVIATTFAVNAKSTVTVVTSCGTGSDTYTCNSCSSADWVRFAIALDAYYCD